jgi:ribosome-associated protein
MTTHHLWEAVRAAQDRKAVGLSLLDLEGICSFTDFFLICSGNSTRHAQAICDAVLEHLRNGGLAPSHVEGYSRADWILIDYLNFVVHIFSERARQFYDLERLWRAAPRIPLPEDGR